MRFGGLQQPPEEFTSQEKKWFKKREKNPTEFAVKKFSGLSSKKENADETTKMESYEEPEYRDFKEYLRYEQRELSAPVIQEARTKRNQLLEARGLLQMSEADFNTYFASKEFDIRADLQQENVGDCYVIAAIYAMSCSPHFETICRSSMKKLPDGSWEVKIPLLSEEGRIITIMPEDLLPQKNRQFLKQREVGEIMPDLRRKLRPVAGKEGLQVLEAAFIKQQFGSVDRSMADLGGSSDKALLALGGDNFISYVVDSVKHDVGSEKWEYPGLNTLAGKELAYLDHYLENFDPEIHIATAATKHDAGGVLGSYRAKGTIKSFVPGHAYSVSEVNSENRTVTLANPWDTSEPIELTFDQFKETFSSFFAIRINSAKLLQNMEMVKEEKNNPNKTYDV